MRWSLILSTFITVLSMLSFVCVALVIPPSWVELEGRAGGAKASSKTYRKASEEHDYAYKFDQTGGVTREKLDAKDRPANGKKMLMIPKTDADHVFEDQMVKNHLAKHNLQLDKLHPDLQKEVKGIINHPQNMAPVPAGVNRGKGQVIKQGMAGKALKPKESRDQYTLLSYTTARKTAKKLDEAFENHGHDFKDKTFHNTLRNTMNNAKIMKPGDPSPAGSSKTSAAGGSAGGSAAGGSDTNSVKATPRRKPIVVGSGRTKVLPIRASSRIAALNKAKAEKKK
ncbi:hypothetical protein BYT27DRAFT_7236253 [Phlegmacium glaucopus]|nr:hypothetical protein BYT27DRAFT_7236253 [Phlegmacium glaucopus]